MAYITAADSMGLSSLNFFVVGSERRIFSATECVLVVQGHPMSPSLEVNPFESLDEFFIPKTGVLGLSVGEDCVILACAVFTQCRRVTDRRTDRRTS